MPTPTWDDDRPLEDWEYPDGDYADDHDDDESRAKPCPMCGMDVYEDAEQCPLCGEWFTRQPGSAWRGKPMWWIVLGLLGIIAVIMMVLSF
jgi:hypothetical protein